MRLLGEVHRKMDLRLRALMKCLTGCWTMDQSMSNYLSWWCFFQDVDDHSTTTNKCMSLKEECNNPWRDPRCWHNNINTWKNNKITRFWDMTLIQKYTMVQWSKGQASPKIILEQANWKIVQAKYMIHQCMELMRVNAIWSIVTPNLREHMCRWWLMTSQKTNQGHQKEPNSIQDRIQHISNWSAIHLHMLSK